MLDTPTRRDRNIRVIPKHVKLQDSKDADRSINLTSTNITSSNFKNNVFPIRKISQFGPGCSAYYSDHPYKILDHSDHIVPPPLGNITIVCCNTTKGEITIAVHPTWAPLGAARFLGMVRDHFFESRVGLFRCMKHFLVQFGLAGDPALHNAYRKKGNLKDDPSWLPLGPTNRRREVLSHQLSITGATGTTNQHRDILYPGETVQRVGSKWVNVSRYQRGYMGYAGAGNNSRGTQLILAFQPNVMLGGGCPW